MNPLSAPTAPSTRAPRPRDSTPTDTTLVAGSAPTDTALRCLAPGEGARMCDEFSTWVMAQPDLAPKFTSVSAPMDLQKRLSKTSMSPTFTSSVTTSALSQNALSCSGTKPMSACDTSEPFNALGLLTFRDDVVIEDFEAL